MVSKDHYAVLGIERTATPAEIKRAYRKLARRHHPDLSQASDANERMVALNEAHAVLSDPTQRVAYDTSQTNLNGSHTGTPASATVWPSGFNFTDAFTGADETTDPNELFDQLFARASPQRSRRHALKPQQGADQFADIELDITEAYWGCERLIALHSTHVTPSGGLAEETHDLQVRVPKGMREGQHIRLVGRGLPGTHGGKPGDLLLQVHFKPDKQWKTVGQDVHGHLEISPWEAMLGGKTLLHAFGRDAELTLPAGWNPGRTLRLKGHGIPGKTPGDLYLELHIVLPPASSDAEKEAYASLARAFPHFAPRAMVQANASTVT